MKTISWIILYENIACSPLDNLLGKEERLVITDRNQLIGVLMILKDWQQKGIVKINGVMQCTNPRFVKMIFSTWFQPFLYWSNL